MFRHRPLTLNTPLRRVGLLGLQMLLAVSSMAQVGSAPQPLSPIGLAEVLARPMPAKPNVPRTSGSLDLKGKAWCIAEYRVLIDQAGELHVAPTAGKLLGRPVAGEEATLAYRSRPDIPVLQALVDRGWADLQERLRAAGLEPEPEDELSATHGSMHPLTAPGSTEAAPVLVEARAGDTLRRYLTLSPTGMKLAAQPPGEEVRGNAGARARWQVAGAEALSLALAVNLSALDALAPQLSRYTAPPGADALSPRLELRPAPGAALVFAQARATPVQLAEAMVLATEFGRLRAAEPPTAAPRPTAAAPADAAQGNALDKLLAAVGKAVSVVTGSAASGVASLGNAVTSAPAATRVDAELELDGAATARLLLYALASANQAIVNALKAATSGTP